MAMRMKSISDQVVDARRSEYKQMFGQDDSRQPVMIDDVRPGTILQHWGLPNQSPFMFLGMMDDRILASMEDGHVVGLCVDAWLVVVSEPSGNRTELCNHAMENIRIVHSDNRAIWAS